MSKRNRNRDRNRNNQAPVPAPASTPLSKADIARINGAKSHGPTSDAGKARSSQNAIKHGLTAKKFMGTPEEQAEFDLHLAATIAHLSPQTDYELYLVTKIARADFLHDRAEDMQNALLDLQLAAIYDDTVETFPNIDLLGANATAFRILDDKSSAHRNLDRHIARLAPNASRPAKPSPKLSPPAVSAKLRNAPPPNVKPLRLPLSSPQPNPKHKNCNPNQRPRPRSHPSTPAAARFPPRRPPPIRSHFKTNQRPPRTALPTAPRPEISSTGTPCPLRRSVLARPFHRARQRPQPEVCPPIPVI
ncbi:MAG: hypothetical protein JNK87_41465 [Bryobacterales bacterium]|nr:hypothetical protein [Bryobacterales bacterium]